MGKIVRRGIDFSGGGGGATHMAKTNRGVLSSYYNYKSEVYLVAGGGGGAGYIGGVTNGSMSNGSRSGNGYASVTFVST